MWNLDTPKYEKSLKVDNATIRSLTFSPDGQSVVMGGFLLGAVQEWKWRQGDDQSIALTSDTKWVSTVLFTHDGTLITAGGDRTIKFLDWETRQVKFTLRGHTGGVQCLALSPDGAHIGIWKSRLQDFTMAYRVRSRS